MALRGNAATLLDLCQLALRQRVDFRRTLARGSRLADHHLGVAPPQFPHVIVEAHALEQLDQQRAAGPQVVVGEIHRQLRQMRSEEHTSELQSLMRISYAVFCLKQKNTT